MRIPVPKSLVAIWLNKPQNLLLDTVKMTWADGTYSWAQLIAWVKAQFDCIFDGVEKKKPVKDDLIETTSVTINQVKTWFILLHPINAAATLKKQSINFRDCFRIKRCCKAINTSRF